MSDLTRRSFVSLAALGGGTALFGCASRPVTKTPLHSGASGPARDFSAQAVSSAHFAGRLDHSDEFLSSVDPELRPALKLLRTEQREKLLDSAMRDRSLRLPAPSVAERTIPGPKDNPQLRVLIVNSLPERVRPAVLSIHGDGFIHGSPEKSWPGTRGLQTIALDHDCVVMAVDYRLAPATPFPGALDDLYAALKWLHTHADSLGVDRERIALMGESAGGGLAAMLAFAARDRGEVPIRSQLLIYPALDDRTGITSKVPPHIGAYVVTAKGMRSAWSQFLGVPAGARTVPKGSVPGRILDVRGLPPTYIGVGSVDLFVNDCISFASRLINAGIATELNVVPGAYHAFFIFAPQANVSRQFISSYNNFLSRTLYS